jgi:hypothetical protein
MRTINIGTQVKLTNSCKHRLRLTRAKVLLCVTSLAVPLVSTAVVKAQCKMFDEIISAYSKARQTSGSTGRKRGTARQRKPQVVADAPDVPVPNAFKFDEFSKIAGCDMKARLDNFAIQLQNAPTAAGSIVTYSVPTNGRNYGRDLAARARDYLVQVRGIDASRIVTIDGGQRNNLTTQLWISR